jgi:hypothetical protein
VQAKTHNGITGICNRFAKRKVIIRDFARCDRTANAEILGGQISERASGGNDQNKCREACRCARTRRGEDF